MNWGINEIITAHFTKSYKLKRLKGGLDKKMLIRMEMSLDESFNELGD